MTQCILTCYAVNVGGYTYGTSEARCRCAVHNWEFGYAPVTATTQCPIGRIEDKVDEAIARIDKYEQDHYHAEHPQNVHSRSGDDDL